MTVTQRKLQSFASDLQKVDGLAEAPPEVTALVAAAKQLGTYRREICWYEKDGLYTLETWSNKDEVPQAMGESVLVEKGKPEWYIKPSPFYGALCTASLEGRLDEIENDVAGNPLSGAKYQITCKGCGSEGWVATAIKCTHVGVRHIGAGFQRNREFIS